MKKFASLVLLVFFTGSAMAADWDSVTQYSSIQGKDGWRYYAKHYTETGWTLCAWSSAPINGYTNVWAYCHSPGGCIVIGRDFQTMTEGSSLWTMREWTCPANLGLTNITVDYNSLVPAAEYGGTYASHDVAFYDASAGTTTTLYHSTTNEAKVLNLTLNLGVGDKLQTLLQNSGAPADVYPVIFTTHIYDPRIPTSCQDVVNFGLVLPGDLSGPNGVPDCRVNLYDFAAMAKVWLMQ